MPSRTGLFYLYIRDISMYLYIFLSPHNLTRLGKSSIFKKFIGGNTVPGEGLKKNSRKINDIPLGTETGVKPIGFLIQRQFYLC